MDDYLETIIPPLWRDESESENELYGEVLESVEQSDEVNEVTDSEYIPNPFLVYF